jgi:hypothetical protein
MRRLDMAGQKFGRLTGVRFVRMDPPHSVWLFRCECGTEIERRAVTVKAGRIKSLRMSPCWAKAGPGRNQASGLSVAVAAMATSWPAEAM